MSTLKNKHLIGLEHTPADDIQLLIDTGFTFREVLDRPIKKVPSLIGKNIVNLGKNLVRSQVIQVQATKEKNGRAGVTFWAPEILLTKIKNLERSGKRGTLFAH